MYNYYWRNYLHSANWEVGGQHRLAVCLILSPLEVGNQYHFAIWPISSLLVVDGQLRTDICLISSPLEVGDRPVGTTDRPCL